MSDATANPPATPIAFLPAAYSPGFSRFFAWYTRRLIAGRFAAFRLAVGSAGVLESAGAERARPLLIAMTHSSWWDPLIGLVLAHRFTPARPPLAPMEHGQLSKFRFMTRLGIFGIDPDHPEAMPRTLDYLLGRFRETPESVLWITPQGRFADPRAPIRLRPGLAALAARLGERGDAPPMVLTIGIELAFWTDQKPEIFARIASVPGGATNTAGWHRAITRSMQANADALAALVIARDPSAFATLPVSAKDPRGSGSGVNPVYNLWLRLRGKDPAIHDRHPR